MVKEKMTVQEFANKYQVFMAMDKDNNWHCYDTKPTITDDEWYGINAYFIPSFIEFTNGKTVSWLSSLHKPQILPKKGELVLVWGVAEYAYVKRFYSFNQYRQCRTKDYSETEIRSWGNYHIFDKTLAETPIKDWPKDDSV